MSRFDEKIVVITGGNSGFRLAAAEQFKTEGATVIVTERDTATLKEAANFLEKRTPDVTKTSDLDSLFATVREKFGKIDVLFVHAGEATKHSSPTKGFRLAYDRYGSGSPVVLLHGWPGDRTDYSQLAPQLEEYADVIVPDLRGFGESTFQADADPEEFYSAPGQARGVIALMDELGVKGAILGGYDVGSLVAQTVASLRPDLVRALVVSPPLPGAGNRILELGGTKEFWYTTFHQQNLIERLIDGKPDVVRTYLRHYWEHWSGPNYVVDEKRLDHLAALYGRPGAFTASMGWYRSSGNPVDAYTQEVVPEKSKRQTTPITVLWQEHDPIFPLAWSDRLGEFYTDYKFEKLPGVGHFTPLEATDKFAAAIRERLQGQAPQ